MYVSCPPVSVCQQSWNDPAPWHSNAFHDNPWQSKSEQLNIHRTVAVLVGILASYPQSGRRGSMTRSSWWSGRWCWRGLSPPCLSAWWTWRTLSPPCRPGTQNSYRTRQQYNIPSQDNFPLAILAATIECDTVGHNQCYSGHINISIHVLSYRHLQYMYTMHIQAWYELSSTW